MNRVCAIHNEYCPDGNCRWCEAPAPDVTGLCESTLALLRKTYPPNVAVADVDREWVDAFVQRWTAGPNDGHGAFE